MENVESVLLNSKLSDIKIALLNSFGLSAITLCSKLDMSGKKDFLLKVKSEDFLINLLHFYPCKAIQAATEEAAINYYNTKNKEGSIKAVQPYVNNLKQSILK